MAWLFFSSHLADRQYLPHNLLRQNEPEEKITFQTNLKAPARIQSKGGLFCWDRIFSRCRGRGRICSIRRNRDRPDLLPEYNKSDSLWTYRWERPCLCRIRRRAPSGRVWRLSGQRPYLRSIAWSCRTLLFPLICEQMSYSGIYGSLCQTGSGEGLLNRWFFGMLDLLFKINN